MILMTFVNKLMETLVAGKNVKYDAVEIVHS